MDNNAHRTHDDVCADLSPAFASAVAMHEQYRVFRRAGFSRAQAFMLLRDVLHDYRMIHAHSEHSGEC